MGWPDRASRACSRLARLRGAAATSAFGASSATGGEPTSLWALALSRLVILFRRERIDQPALRLGCRGRRLGGKIDLQRDKTRPHQDRQDEENGKTSFHEKLEPSPKSPRRGGKSPHAGGSRSVRPKVVSTKANSPAEAKSCKCSRQAHSWRPQRACTTHRPSRSRSPRNGSSSGIGVDLFDRLFDRIGHAAELDLVVGEQDVAGPRVAVARLADAADVDHHLARRAADSGRRFRRAEGSGRPR